LIAQNELKNKVNCFPN